MEVFRLVKQCRINQDEDPNDPFDPINLPGGVKKLVRPRSEDALADVLVDIKITFGHKPEEYILILHNGCVAYGDDFPDDPEDELKKGKKIFEDFLAREGYKAKVRMIFKDWDKVYEVV